MNNLNKKTEELLLSQQLDDSDESGSSESGGQSGGIAFHDFIGTGASRDDLLSPEQKKQLIFMHQDTHGLRVEKEKEARLRREEVRTGKMPLQEYRHGLSSGSSSSQYKMNPKLDVAQFSGIGKEVTSVPTDFEANTNEAELQLKNQPQLRYAPQNAPRFNPKPRPGF